MDLSRLHLGKSAILCLEWIATVLHLLNNRRLAAVHKGGALYRCEAIDGRYISVQRRFQYIDSDSATILYLEAADGGQEEGPGVIDLWGGAFVSKRCLPFAGADMNQCVRYVHREDVLLYRNPLYI